MTWCVMVKPPDDHPAAVETFGPFASRERAERFCTLVREACEAEDEAHPDDPDFQTGYAWVTRLRSVGSGGRALVAGAEAKLWATKGQR